MASRTTLVLDQEAREAARQLARRYGCSLSEAMRRALVRQRDADVGGSAGAAESVSEPCGGSSTSSRRTTPRPRSAG